MIINDVHQGITKHKRPKRRGKGIGSGMGKTASRGHKGHSSRSGHAARRGFTGGQTPLYMRVAKRGFNNRYNAEVVKIINLSQLDEMFNDGDVVNPQVLAERSIIKGNYDVLKILGNGEISKKITVHAHRFSGSAIEKIQKAGGTIEQLIVLTKSTENK
ncbi:large ribosomal subunit protein uL15 [Lacunimicrobium album]